MSWIQDNKFVATLGGATLLGTVALFYVGISYHGRYSSALQRHRDAAAEVEEFEAIPLYPSPANRAGKTKALNLYRASITGLQTAFDKFRPKELPNISPQGFTDHAKAANEEVAKAFEKVGTKLPEAFFLGFEAYNTGALAREDATGLLDYQLGATKELLLTLAKTSPSQVQNLYRPRAPEEDGEKWEAAANDAARSFPIEITFKGSERSVRDFISAIGQSPGYFFTVRSVRIMNEKQVAPRAADAKFDTPPPAGGGKAAADPFGGAGGFVIPSDEPAPATPAPATPPRTPAPAGTPASRPAPATPAPARAATPVAAATPARVDSSRILNQVLGNEELQVFLHIDVLQFLPVKALPEVPK
jgi:hypothetical protein